MTEHHNAAAPPPVAPSVGLFDFLDATHREIHDMLLRLRQLGGDIDLHGLTDATRAEASTLCAWFNLQARQHHMDEDEHVFPTLLRSPDAETVRLTERLMQDHGWLEENWIEIEPALSAAGGGYTWFDPAALVRSIQLFVDLYLEHMALEETLAYPQARKLIAPNDAHSMAEHIARRRARLSAR